MTTKRPITLWQLCLWAYHRQQAHVFLKTPYQWFQWALAQSGAEPDGPRPQVHHDAAMLHDAVISLSHRDADVIVWHAAMGAQPEIPDLDLEAKSYPLDTDRAEDYGRAQIGGRMVDYAIRVMERVSAVKPVYRRSGRKGVKRVGTELVIEDVCYCPIIWEPDPIFIGAALAVYQGWATAMGRLHVLIEEADLREFEIEGEPPAVPPSRPVEMIFDSWREGTRSAALATEATLTTSFPPYAATLTADGLKLRKRQARATLGPTR